MDASIAGRSISRYNQQQQQQDEEERQKEHDQSNNNNHNNNHSNNSRRGHDTALARARTNSSGRNGSRHNADGDGSDD